MRGILVVNGYYSSAAYENQRERLLKELTARGVQTFVYKNNRPVPVGTRFSCDFAVFLDKDIALAKMMEAGGVRLFNSSFAIETTDDKVKTYVALSEQTEIEIPVTVPAPVRYDNGIDRIFLEDTAKKLGFPLIIKENASSLGMGVYLAKDMTELSELAAGLAKKPHHYQEFIKESIGKSIRIIVIGGKAAAAMRLENNKDFRSNAEAGGTAHAIPLSSEYQKKAENIARCLGLDFCGVDFFSHKEMLIEVNGNAFFRHIEESTGKNIAGEYADYIVKTVKTLFLSS